MQRFVPSLLDRLIDAAPLSPSEPTRPSLSLEQLKDAVLINPYSAEEMSDAIVFALAMDKAERIRRWRTLMDSVETEDVVWWRQRFVDALMVDASVADDTRLVDHPV